MVNSLKAQAQNLFLTTHATYTNHLILTEITSNLNDQSVCQMPFGM